MLFAYQWPKHAFNLFKCEILLLFIVIYLLFLKYLNSSVLDVFISKCFVVKNGIRILA